MMRKAFPCTYSMLVFPLLTLFLELSSTKPRKAYKPRPRAYSETLPTNYTICGKAIEPDRFRNDSTANGCDPKNCYTDCVCNHLAIDGTCETISLASGKRCVCFRIPGHPPFKFLSLQKCLSIREPVFEASKFAMLQGCNQICRSDCICNHGAPDGMCSTIQGLAYCSCIYDAVSMPSLYQ